MPKPKTLTQVIYMNLTSTDFECLRECLFVLDPNWYVAPMMRTLAGVAQQRGLLHLVKSVMDGGGN